MSRTREIAAFGVVLLGFCAHAIGADWEVHTPPMIEGTGISVVGDPNSPPGTTIIIQKKQVINLSAKVIDVDKRLKASSTEYEYKNDIGEVEWSKTGGGTLAPARTGSGVSTTYTAPDAVGDYTITATPDDKPDLADDAKNTTGKVTLTVRVVDACPTTAATGSPCNPVPKWDKWKTHGCLVAQVTVSGGTPPAPATNWDGLIVKHVRTKKSATCMDTDFDKPFNCELTTSFTVGNSYTTGWVNGTAANMVQRCYVGDASNCFNNLVSASFESDLALKAGKGPCEVKCDEEYFCNTTSLGKTVLTLTYTLDGPNCKVVISR